LASQLLCSSELIVFNHKILKKEVKFMSLPRLAEHSIQECQSSTNLTDANKLMENDNFDRVMLQMNIADQSIFKKELAVQWKQAAIQQEMISVLSCEIDFYSEYVKNYSVQGASFMLISIALTLKNICDLYGCLLTRNDSQGFNILIKGGTESSVRGIADSLCEAVKQSQTEHKYSKIGNIITLSMGVSALHPQTMELFKGNAKAALYNAKESGGNQCKSDKQQNVYQGSAEDHFEYPELMPEKPIMETETNEAELQVSAEIQSETIPHNEPSTRMYRGQKIEVENGMLEKNAPISSKPAPNKDKVNDLAEPEKANVKQKSVRMYRGQIIND
jgi:diguanylate cyclase (GGDEF)-like protein